MTSTSNPLLAGEALGDAMARLVGAVRPRSIVDGWATVELDRAAIEVAAAHSHDGEATVEPADDERLLGARCRLLRFGNGSEVLLLEPSTEGRLAAALARHGEGTLVQYLVADHGALDRARRAGFGFTSEGRGPFGPERLAIVGPRHGPFLIVASPG